MSSGEVAVNGYPIAYRIVDGKVYVLGDDLGGYFGYSRNRSNGKCSAIYPDSGVGLCKPKVFLEFAGSKRLFYPYSGISRFAQLCASDRGDIAKKFIAFKARFDNIPVSVKQNHHVEVEKVKMLSLEERNGEWFAKFSNGKEKKVSPKKCTVDYLTTCSITNKLIPCNVEHMLIEIKRKGYGLFRIKQGK